VTPAARGKAAAPAGFFAPTPAVPGLKSLFPAGQVLAVVAAAALLRGLYWALATRSAFFHAPVVDASFFDIWARTLAEGRVFQDQAFFKPPLYPYLLAGLYRLGLGLAAVQALQMAVGVLTVVLTLGVGRLVFAPRTAFYGALAAGLLPILPFFEGQLLAETWTTALTMGGLLAVLLALTGPAGRTRRLVVGGLLLGLAALGRPNLMLLIVVLAFWLWRSAAGTGRRDLGAALLVLAAAAAGIAPATLHNAGKGEFVLISANAGANLVAGNQDGADGISPIPVGVRWDDLQLSTQQAGAVRPGAASRYLTREALGWIGGHPGRFLALLGRKALLLVGGWEPRNNINPLWMAGQDGVFLLGRWWPGTWLLLPPALVGLVFAARGAAGARLLRWLLLAQAVGVLPFFVNARFRAPLLPVLALFAAAGVAVLWSRRRDVRVIVAAVVAFAVVNVSWFGLGDTRWLARDHYNRAMISLRNPAAALTPEATEAQFLAAIAGNPSDPDFPESYGAFILQQAQPLVEQAARREADAPAQAVALHAEAGPLLQEAAARHQEAARLYPRSFRSWANLGVCRLWLGDGAAAAARLALSEDDSTSARARALEALGSYQRAVEALHQALQVNPAMGGAQSTLARVWPAVLALPPLDERITAAQAGVRRMGGGEVGRRGSGGNVCCR